VACILIGYVVWLRKPALSIGPMILSLGTVYYLQDLRASANPLLFAIGFALAYLWIGVFAHALLTWPTGLVSGRINWVLIGYGYLAPVSTSVLRLVVDHPHPPIAYDTPATPTVASRLASLSLIALMVVVIAVTARRWLAASGARRRWRAPIWAAVLLVAIASSAPAAASIVHMPIRVVNTLILVAIGTGMFLVPIVLVLVSTKAGRARWRLARMVLDPHRVGELKLRPALLQQELAHALGDPSLRIAYPLGDGRYVDVDGRPSAAAAAGAGRSVTTVEVAGEVVAVIEHDEVLHEHQRVAATVAEVAGVAIENARMHATLRAQIEQIKTSRLRVSSAAFDERRRIQRNLHDAAQQQFLAVLVLLDVARGHLDANADTATVRSIIDRAHHQLHDAVAALRELTQGIYPAVLTEHGLAPAVESIADVSPIPIDVDIARTRWPQPVEATAYFLIAEAVANAYKHAQATYIAVAVTEQDRRLQVAISDDGRGGATIRPGGGLAGMHDRVNTVGGALTLSSEPGDGTTVAAQLPLETS
jgi:signal transduction histidine kinase